MDEKALAQDFENRPVGEKSKEQEGGEEQGEAELDRAAAAAPGRDGDGGGPAKSGVVEHGKLVACACGARRDGCMTPEGALPGVGQSVSVGRGIMLAHDDRFLAAWLDNMNGNRFSGTDLP